MHDLGRAAPLDAGHLLHRQQLRAEPLRLGGCAASEVAAAEAGREAEVVLDARALAGLAAERLPLHQRGLQALGCSVDGGRQPGRPAADDQQIVERQLRAPEHAGALRQLGDARAAHRAAVREEHQRQLGLAVRGGEQPTGIGVTLHVEPAVGHLVPRQEIARLVGLARPAVADDLDPVGRRGRLGPPGVEQVVDHRIQLLLGRIPGLEQVVVERDLVDRVDRGLGIGVGREQHAARLGGELERLLEQLHSRHARHALVDHQQRNRGAAQRHVAQQLERLLPALGAKHAELLAVAAAQVALDRTGDGGLVVDREQHRPGLLGSRLIAHESAPTVKATSSS